MTNTPDRRPLRLGLLTLVLAAVAAITVIPATSSTVGRAPTLAPGAPGAPDAIGDAHLPAASTVPAGSVTLDCRPAGTPSARALLSVAEATEPPAPNGTRDCGRQPAGPAPRPARAEPAPSPARTLASKARSGQLGCDELDAHEAQGLVTAGEATTLRATTGCPVAPPVASTVRYQVAVVGAPQADLAEFRRLAAQALADPRGWRGAGIAFTEVAEGGDFTLWLAQAETVPSFGEPCHASWSCRAGADVIINDTRWQEASPAWTGGGGDLPGYRRMVVGHEVGHWLGLGHENCATPGTPAPLMQQQSKDLFGCTPNPWPLPAELAAVTVGAGPWAGAGLAGG